MSNAQTRPTVDFNAWKKRYTKKNSKTLTLADGSSFEVPPRAVWPAPLTGDDGEQNETLIDWTKRVISDENWAKFEADGNTFDQFWAWLNDGEPGE